MKDIETSRPYLCYPFGVAETLKQNHGIHSLTQLIEDRSKTWHEPVIGMPYQSSKQWLCDMYTYKDIFNGINALCDHFLREKIVPERTEEDGTRQMVVALIAPSNIDMMMSMLALQRLGLAVLLITPHQTETVIKHLCHDMKVIRIISPLNIDDLETIPLPPSEIWRAGIRQPGKAYTRCLSPEVEGDTYGVIYHSSGTSSGKPKPLPSKHKFLVSFCAHKHTDLATLTTTPLNTGGTADICRSMCADAMLFLFPDDVPLTAKNVCDARKVCSQTLGREVGALSCVPYVAKMLAENEESFKMLQELEFCGIGGAPLPKATGDFMVNAGVPLVSRMGSSECNFLMSSYRDYTNDKDWDYLRSEPGGHHFTFIPQNDGTTNCELEVSASWPALAVAPNKPGAFRTGDLFQPHPTTPHAWLYLGRSDDTIVLENGKKADPKALEGTLRGLKYLKNALVFGVGKNNIGLFIIEEESGPRGEDLRQKVWQEVVQEINEKGPAHAEVYYEMIKVLPYTEDFVKTPKGTIIRNATYAKFQASINSAYEQSRTKLNIPDTQLDEYITQVIRNTSNKRLDQDTDLFGAGVNSLQSVRIRNILSEELELNLPSNIVFEEPSIAQIIAYVRATRAGTTKQAFNAKELMQELVHRYSLPPPSTTNNLTDKVKKSSSADQGETILLTGVTGGLGSHILATILSQITVKIKSVLCLVRASERQNPENRVRETLEYRKISLPQSDVAVQFLDADLTLTDLGLGESAYEELKSNVTLIIHAAWPVNFNAHLTSFESAIKWTSNLLNLSRDSKHQSRFFFCSSTASVISSKSAPIPETLSSREEDSSPIGYAQSKWITEQIVDSYSSVTTTGIFRIGQLCGDTRHGVWSESEGWSLMFKSIDVVQAMPGLREDNVAWLPVDLAASSIVEIAMRVPVREILAENSAGSSRGHCSAGIWHITNPGIGRTWQDILTYLRSFGLRFDILEPYRWVERLESSSVDNPRENPCRKLLGLWKSSYTSTSVLQSDPIFETTRAQRDSSKLKHCGAVDEQLMHTILQNWRDSGFLNG